MEFDSIPKQTRVPKPPPFGGFEKHLIDDEIVTLKSKGAIEEVSSCPNEFLSNIFLVPKKTGDMRPVINLKPLNVFVQKIHFKMENINTALHTIAPGDYLVSLDLKDAYFSIPIFKPHRKFLRFKWSDQTYEFTCLPFGYSLAPRVFTKVLKPVISYLRANGYRVIIFLDDILLIGSSMEECLSPLSSLRDLLQSLGFVINVNKSQLIPVTRILYLGFIIDTVSMTLLLPDEKIVKILGACQNLLTYVNPSVREVAHVIGLLVSAFPAVSFLKLHYRSIELCKSRALSVNPDFDQKIQLDPNARSDLQWVIENISRLNGFMFGNRPADVYIESDASLAGWGAVCNGQSANGRWSLLESEHHINYLELLAAFHALQAFVADKSNIHVRLKMDNSTAVSYINNMGGIRSPSLDELAVSIWGWCSFRNILLSAQHIPGKSNREADSLSRQFVSNLEWLLDQDVFNRLVVVTFLPDIDLFASRLNAKLDQFVSWHPEPGALAVDAFSISWSNQKFYAFPPFSLLTRVLAKIQNDVALVLLIAPTWSTQPWYPMLLQLAIARPVLLPRVNHLLTLPHSNQVHPMLDSLHLAGWTLSGNPSLQRDFLMRQSDSSMHLGLQALTSNTIQFGRDGVAGVRKGKLILFRHL